MRPLDSERAKAVAAAKIAARYGAVCGGIDLEATLEALGERVRDARGSLDESERALAEGITRELEAAGLSLEGM